MVLRMWKTGENARAAVAKCVRAAAKREMTGKQYAKKLRSEGRVPGIYYAHKEKNIPLMFDTKELLHLLETESGLFDVKIDGKRAKKCIIKEVQFDPASNKLLHLDIMGVKLKEKITVSIPIQITGEAHGVKDEGGTLSHSLHELEISCLPLDLPENVEIDVTHLGVGDSIYVRDLELDKVDIVTDSEVLIVSVGMTRAAKVEETPAEAEEAEAEKSAEEAEKES